VVGLIFSFCWKGCFACRGVGFGLMESWFFVEAKSFRFSVETGSAELRVEEKRKGFSGFAVFGLSCTAWMLSRVEEVLGNPGIEDFVKSFREGLRRPSLGEVKTGMGVSWRLLFSTEAGEDVFSFLKVGTGEGGAVFPGS
jgi:hypothetical protein